MVAIGSGIETRQAGLLLLAANRFASSWYFALLIWLAFSHMSTWLFRDSHHAPVDFFRRFRSVNKMGQNALVSAARLGNQPAVSLLLELADTCKAFSELAAAQQQPPTARTSPHPPSIRPSAGDTK